MAVSWNAIREENPYMSEESSLSEDVVATIKEQIESNPILLYMKGSPAAPHPARPAR